MITTMIFDNFPSKQGVNTLPDCQPGTAVSATPATCCNAFVTCRAQASQVIPCTSSSICSISFILFPRLDNKT